MVYLYDSGSVEHLALAEATGFTGAARICQLYCVHTQYQLESDPGWLLWIRIRELLCFWSLVIGVHACRVGRACALAGKR